MRLIKTIAATGLVCLTTSSFSVAHELGYAGLLSSKNRADIPEITLSAGEPLSKESTFTLESGRYYELEITSDGSAELALTGPGFFRAIWIDEVVINDLEVRPYGIDSIEFDDAGEMEIGFVAVKPGNYRLYVPGSKGETQGIDIIIK